MALFRQHGMDGRAAFDAEATLTPTMKGVTEDTIMLKAIMRKPIARWSMANLSAARIAAYLLIFLRWNLEEKMHQMLYR